LAASLRATIALKISAAAVPESNPFIFIYIFIYYSWNLIDTLIDTNSIRDLIMPDEKKDADFYGEAVQRIWDELDKLQEQERQLTVRKAQLIQSFNALAPLAFPDEKVFDINSLTLADAIRLVIRSTSVPMKARQVKSRLYELGFLLGKFKNPNASVHTAINRMLDSGELTLITDSTDGTKYIESGPSLKPTPATLSLEKMRKLSEVTKNGKPPLRTI
jgi:hypothetical protein